jgi:hypothetical protein
MNRETQLAAERYIHANKSDPFTRARVYTHARVMGIFDGKPLYDAEEYNETVKLDTPLSNGDTEFIRIGYKNVSRV